MKTAIRFPAPLLWQPAVFCLTALTISKTPVADPRTTVACFFAIADTAAGTKWLVSPLAVPLLCQSCRTQYACG